MVSPDGMGDLPSVSLLVVSSHGQKFLATRGKKTPQDLARIIHKTNFTTKKLTLPNKGLNAISVLSTLPVL